MTSVPFLNRSSRGQATAAAVAAAAPAVMTSQYLTKSVRPHADPLAPEATVDLLARAKRGDRSALELLLERCIPALRRWAHARLPQSARGMVDTADMVQDTVLAALRRLDVFEARHQGALQAYLRTAVMNRIRDVIRQRDRRPMQGELPEDVLDEATSPLEQLIGAQNVSFYEAALGRLRSSDREAIVGRIELQYSYEELATVLNKPTANAARVAVARALKRLVDEMRQAS
jgi:RNA polymerase sigma factor (sigma-70 family)